MKNLTKNRFVVGCKIVVSLFLLSFLVGSTALYAGQKSEDGKWVVVIDAGHGGRDPGSVGRNSKEKDITLSVALKTGKYLEDNLKNVKVVYTRTTDKAVSLSERPRIAIRNNADLFISIHTNSATNRSASGTETFIMGLAKDAASFEVAKRENQVISFEEDFSTKYENFDAQSDESYIIFSLENNQFLKQSTNLAEKIQTQFRDRVGRRDRGVKQAGYWVLYNVGRPSVLTEIGFISNTAEEQFLMSEDGQTYIASAIYRACRDYINEIDNSSATGNQVVVGEQKVSSVEQNEKEAKSETDYTFGVQIVSSTTKLNSTSSSFKGYKDVEEIYHNARYKYIVGNFESYDEAVEYKKNIAQDFQDAFVVAIQNETIISISEAVGK